MQLIKVRKIDFINTTECSDIENSENITIRENKKELIDYFKEYTNDFIL